MSLRLRDYWRTAVQNEPERTMLIDASNGRAWSRREIDAQTQSLRAALPPELAGRPVIFALPNGIDWLATFLALLEVGAIAVPLDPTEPPARQNELAQRIGGSLWTGSTLTSAAARASRRRPELCLIKLTSGSSGQPRALAFTDAQMIADGRQVCASMGITADDLNLAIIPFGHSYGLGNLVIPCLIQGTPMLVPRAPLPRILGEDCARWRPTVFPSVPALLRLLVNSEVAPAAFTSLRTVISAGSPLPPETAQQFVERFQRPVHGFYGSSETGGISYDRTGEATLSGRSVGSPLEGVRVTSTRGQRFVVESEAVYTCGNRRVTAEGKGRHQPADRGAFNERGELVLLGRTGRMLKVAGRRLDLGELEQLLRKLPGVQDAWAAVHPQRPDELAAALQTTRGERELRAELGRALPAWKIPRRLLLLPQFPLTARGKVDTRVLARRLQGSL